MAIGASEKLAQEGLRGNRDRFAVEACVPHARPVGARVPRARMVGRSPRNRRLVERVPRDRRPPRRPVRIHDNSNHRNGPAFQKRWRGLRPSFLSRKHYRGKMKGSN